MPQDRISQVARLTGFSPATLRYYEKIDLLYDVRLLEFIARGKRLGLSLDQIRSLVDAWRRDDCRSTQERYRPRSRLGWPMSDTSSGNWIVFRDQLDEVHRGLIGQTGPAHCGLGCGCKIDVSRIDSDSPRILALVSVNRSTVGAPPSPRQT